MTVSPAMLLVLERLRPQGSFNGWHVFPKRWGTKTFQALKRRGLITTCCSACLPPCHVRLAANGIAVLATQKSEALRSEALRVESRAS